MLKKRNAAYEDAGKLHALGQEALSERQNAQAVHIVETCSRVMHEKHGVMIAL